MHIGNSRVLRILEKRWIGLAIVLLIAFLVYANTLKYDFVYDDEVLIVRNSLIRDWRNVPSIFISPFMDISDINISFYRPLAILSFLSDYALWDLNSVGYHLTNLLFHLANGVLVYLILGYILNSSIIVHSLFPLLTTLFFLIHPIQTESVAFISNRNGVMFVFFYLWSLLLYIRRSKNCPAGYPIMSSILFLFALLSKEEAITLPLIILLYDYYFSSPGDWRLINKRIKYYLPFLVVIGAYFFLRWNVLGGLGQATTYCCGNFYATMLTMLRVFVYYIKLLVFPLKLCVSPTFQISSSFFDLSVILSLSLLLSILVVAFYLSSRYREISFAILWFFITLIPVSNILPLTVLLAERFLYLPSIGFCMLSAILIVKIYNSSSRKVTRIIFSLFACLLISFYLVRIRVASSVWKDNFTLWSRTVRLSPNSPTVRNNLGLAYEKMGSYSQAVTEYGEAIRLAPGYGKHYFHLANAYRGNRQYEEAIDAYRKAIEIDPEMVDSYINLGNLYGDIGQYDEAIKTYKDALEIKPNSAEIYNNLGIVFCQKGNYREGIDKFRRALEINPNYEDARKNYEQGSMAQEWKH